MLNIDIIALYRTYYIIVRHPAYSSNAKYQRVTYCGSLHLGDLVIHHISILCASYLLPLFSARTVQTADIGPVYVLGAVR